MEFVYFLFKILMVFCLVVCLLLLPYGSQLLLCLLSVLSQLHINPYCVHNISAVGYYNLLRYVIYWYTTSHGEKGECQLYIAKDKQLDP